MICSSACWFCSLRLCPSLVLRSFWSCDIGMGRITVCSSKDSQLSRILAEAASCRLMLFVFSGSQCCEAVHAALRNAPSFINTPPVPWVEGSPSESRVGCDQQKWAVVSSTHLYHLRFFTGCSSFSCFFLLGFVWRKKRPKFVGVSIQVFIGPLHNWALALWKSIQQLGPKIPAEPFAVPNFGPKFGALNLTRFFWGQHIFSLFGSSFCFKTVSKLHPFFQRSLENGRRRLKRDSFASVWPLWVWSVSVPWWVPSHLWWATCKRLKIRTVLEETSLNGCSENVVVSNTVRFVLLTFWINFCFVNVTFSDPNFLMSFQ